MVPMTKGHPDHGISPPAWGSLVLGFIVLTLFGNIPTCVGQPYTPAPYPLGLREYPHLRGAAGSCYRRGLGMGGISPPAWGSLYAQSGAGGCAGNIPTCVGQPMSIPDIHCMRWEYPHLRGAAYRPTQRLRLVRGISPPAWGSHQRIR